MSDDLISRKAVIDYLREQNNNVIIEKYKDGFVSEDTCRGMESAIRAFRNFILTLPTAFDKGKVIEELRQEALYELGISEEKFNSDEGEYSSYCSISFSQAKRIVEKGGV